MTDLKFRTLHQIYGLLMKQVYRLLIHLKYLVGRVSSKCHDKFRLCSEMHFCNHSNKHASLGSPEDCWNCINYTERLIFRCFQVYIFVDLLKS